MTKADPIGPIWQAVILHMMHHVYDMSIQLPNCNYLLVSVEEVEAVWDGNRPWEILIMMSPITMKSSSTSNESHKKLDPVVRNLMFSLFMGTGGEINQSGTELVIPRINIWKNYINTYCSTFFGHFYLLRHIFSNFHKLHHNNLPAHTFLWLSLPLHLSELFSRMS